jgi:hypothetical protein
VDKDNPRGPAPEHPESDPQFNNWENAIQDWIKRNKEANPAWNISFDDPPKDIDDAHSMELTPKILINTPKLGDVLNSRQISIYVQASAPRGVIKVSYYLDNTPIGESSSAPFSYSYYASWLNNGEHTLRAIASDDIGNNGEGSVRFNLSTNEVPAAAYWATNKLTVSHDEGVKYIYLNPTRLEDIKKITIYQELGGLKNPITELSNFSNLFNNQILVAWPVPQTTGLWKISGQCELKNGNTSEVYPLEIEVK